MSTAMAVVCAAGLASLKEGKMLFRCFAVMAPSGEWYDFLGQDRDVALIDRSRSAGQVRR